MSGPHPLHGGVESHAQGAAGISGAWLGVEPCGRDFNGRPPPFDSAEQLLLLAGDRVGWREAVVGLLPVSDPGHPEAQARKKKKKKKDSKSADDSGCGFVDGKLAQVI